ncbi:phasin family protein [Algiphilus sp.]|uniref:phasin family protein n=1 Tax=Algiphilus sp. TaxID=1872431 RepID=UPI001CA66C3A|nr:phasin family protein [Algiphilus sp.]MBY8966301.1 phasin family protein [Algiphilus acroporae]MCI5061512.1 phasin family protein [Algiphilus sp.]MCI5102238.1 phasin family protein [Algiphilus sp.]MCR9090390.1 phasin family protein [Pseudomonadota bacterium]
MNFETVVNDVKTRVEDVSNRAQNVAELSLETAKKANGIVVPTMQNIFEKQTSAARELFESGRTSFIKVRNDGLKAVAANPADYLPAGRTVVVDAFSASVDLTTKAGTELAEVLRKAYEDALASINGKKVAKPAAKKTARKASSARKTASKSTAAKKSAATKASA